MTGGSLTLVTVKTAPSEPEAFPGSVAIKVIVSLPYQLEFGVDMEMTRDTGL